MITEPILALIVAMVVSIIPAGTMGAVVVAPELPRRPLALVAGAWGAAHGLVWLWAQYQLGAADAMSVYAWFNAGVGAVAAVVILVWPR